MSTQQHPDQMNEAEIKAYEWSSQTWERHMRYFEYLCEVQVHNAELEKERGLEPNFEQLAFFHMKKVLESLRSKMDLRVMAQGYSTLVSDHGEVWCLTAGDHNYEPAAFWLDMSGWQTLPEPRELAEGNWERNWEMLPGPLMNHPGMYVTKNTLGTFHLNEARFGRHPYRHPYLYWPKDAHARQVQVMTYEKFKEVAPTEVKDKLVSIEYSTVQDAEDAHAILTSSRVSQG